MQPNTQLENQLETLRADWERYLTVVCTVELPGVLLVVLKNGFPTKAYHCHRYFLVDLQQAVWVLSVDTRDATGDAALAWLADMVRKFQ